MAAQSDANAGSISLEEALQRADGRGVHAWRVLWSASAACLCGGMGGSVAPFLLESLSTEGNYAPWEKSLLATSMFAGMMAGSLVGGVLSDVFGPGRVMMASVISLSLSGVMPIASATIGMAATARMVVGLSLCAIYQAANTFVAESIITSRRTAFLSVLHIAIALGGLSTTLLALALQGRSWRVLLALNSAPSLLVLAGAGCFVCRSESPRWLLISGPPGACEQLLSRIAQESGALSMREAPLPPILVQRASDGGSGCGNVGDSSSGTGVSGADNDCDGSGGGDGCSTTAGQVTWDGGGSGRETVMTVRFSPRRRLAELMGLWRLHAYGCTLSFCLNFGSKGSEIWVRSCRAWIGLACGLTLSPHLHVGPARPGSTVWPHPITSSSCWPRPTWFYCVASPYLSPHVGSA